jgi:two-component system, OmpR family, response regulator PhoP
MSPHKAKILIIDDDEAILQLYQDVLSPAYEVTAVQDWLEGANLLVSKPFDLLILDLRMSVFDPIEFIKRIRTEGPAIPILVSSAFTNLRERVADVGVDAILAKPFTIPDLERTIQELLNK